MGHEISNWLTYLIAIVWFINGFLCKVLDLVPRHQKIIERILGIKHGRLLTVLIGFSEIGMGVWVLSGLYSRINVFAQIAIIVTMNVLEFFLASDLLLWGKTNSFFAFLFIILICYNEFYLLKVNSV